VNSDDDDDRDDDGDARNNVDHIQEGAAHLKIIDLCSLMAVLVGEGQKAWISCKCSRSRRTKTEKDSFRRQHERAFIMAPPPLAGMPPKTVGRSCLENRNGKSDEKSSV